MTKNDELTKENSCINKAGPEEIIFVLLARDPAAPTIIRLWCSHRMAIGMNKRSDAQIQEALECADLMDKQRLGK